LGFTQAGRPGSIAPGYPPGLPLHMAAAALLFGWKHAPFLVAPLASLVCLWLMYLVGRQLQLPPAFAAAGAAVLGFFPTFAAYSLQAMSDVPATAWALAAVLAALRSRESAHAAFLAGAAFAVAVLVRPTNALLLAPLLAALPSRPGILARFALGGLPLSALLLAYNAAAFGSPWRTGYGTLEGQMAPGNFVPDARHYFWWLLVLGSPVLILGFLAVAADRKVPLRDRALLFAWFGSFFLFYCFYEPYEDWLVTRFLLPGLPAMILAALLGARDAVAPAPGATGSAAVRLRWAACLLMLCAVLGFGAHAIARFDVLGAYRGEQTYPLACRLAEGGLPKNAVVASMQMTGALRYYTGLTFARWDWMDAGGFPLLRAQVEARGGRWFALVAPFERDGLQKNLPGRWTQLGSLREYALLRLETPVRPSNLPGAGVP
ncbi:MAG: glycosyltransferase family 39 protein, partial [Thermoanaerobaculia bacterium]